jgi:eukaryotic-like serine/threonine-protein kinase
MPDNQTFVDPTEVPSAGDRQEGGPTRPGVARTVLPRIEREGVALRVVHESRERYQAKEVLGSGGMGEVRLAEDQDIGREVAIKRLHGNLRGSSALSRFVQEIRTVGSMEHPNIVPIHDVGVDGDGDYFFAMKHLDGETVEQIVRRLVARDPAAEAEWTVERRLGIVRGVLHALESAHARGLVHRDIKPANVMVGRHGEVVLMDWGVAKEIGADELPGDGAVGTTSTAAHATQAGAMIGTPAYMSPEQLRGDRLDVRADVFSLGVLLF